MTLRRTISLLAGGLCLLALLSCEVRTSVRLGSGPSFSLGGSGRLASFTIYGPQSGHKIATPNDAKSQVWSIQPAGGYPDSVPVTHMNLVYGSVPEGYTQTVPNRGTAPALTAGLVYYFFAETTGAPGKEGFFYMDKATPILIRVPDLCESGFTGDVKPLKCGTREPYVEPKDLEQFVRDNQVRK
jgi:hypothetical protein